MTPTPTLAPGTSVARQPIRHRDGAVAGHEYLYRSPTGRAAGVDRWSAARQDAASAAVLRALYGTGAPGGPGLVFVNVTRAFLVGERPLPAPDGRLVLEVVESVPADAATVEGIARLRALGYRVALDDWTSSPAQMALLAHADFVKVDCRDLGALGDDGLRRACERGASLVAERVSSGDLLERCLDLGFDLLQGYALGRPALLEAA